MSPISKSDLDQISMTIASAMSQGFAQLTAALSQPVAASRAATAKTSYRYSGFLPRGAKAAPSDLAAKDARILAAFKRRGFDAHLMDRNDPKVPYDCRPYRKWLEVGRVVRKGQRGVAGLFHVTQTDALPTATPPKGKGKLTAVKA
jgi:hypothetical protein